MTSCVHMLACELGSVKDGIVELRPEGRIVQYYWDRLFKHYERLEKDEFIVMPNHVHMIFCLNPHDDDKTSLPEMVRAFKSFSSRDINRLRQTIGRSFWHRSYYERIIRNERELHLTRQYIRNNPSAWDDVIEHHYHQFITEGRVTSFPQPSV